MRDNIELTYNVYMFACSITFIVVLYFDFFFFLRNLLHYSIEEGIVVLFFSFCVSLLM